MKKYHQVIIIIIALLCLISGFMVGTYVGKLKGMPLIGSEYRWSIGIYSGKDPFDFDSIEEVKNPVLTVRDVTDIHADFVADPFMVKEGSTWYMFFEVMNASTDQGDIGFAVSNDGLNWAYEHIVLDEAFHLAYPYVFKWKNDYYMIPESKQAYSVRLYKAVDFPTQWAFVGILLHGSYVDSSIFRYEDKWWMFTTDRNDVLRLYYSGDLLGTWTEHPKSPLIMGNAKIARPAGRVIVLNDRIIRYAQNDESSYGNQVRAFEITMLTETFYEEKEVRAKPILKASGMGWNKKGMHHIDPHQIEENKWIACVDGFNTRLVFGFLY